MATMVCFGENTGIRKIEVKQLEYDLTPVGGLDHYRVNQAVAIKHWPALVAAWIKGGADLLQQKLEEFVVILTVSLDKLRPGKIMSPEFRCQRCATA